MDMVSFFTMIPTVFAATATAEARVRHTITGKEDPSLPMIMSRWASAGLLARLVQAEVDQLICHGGCGRRRGTLDSAFIHHYPARDTYSSYKRRPCGSLDPN